MGVKGLTRFVRLEQEKLLKDHKLHHTRLVIDGDNLTYLLWEHFAVEQKYGGDYDVFAKKCRVFIEILRTCHVQPHVIFDGGYALDERKIKTVLDRKQQRIRKVDRLCKTGRGSVIPCLAKETFIHVLDEMGIPKVCCEFEADRELAVLANKFNCPVMSFDSDFYIYDLTAGFIPFDYVQMKTDIEIVGSGYFEYIPVKLYLRSRFARRYKLDPEILPLFACCLGNDFVEVHDLHGFYFENNLNLVEKENRDFKKKVKKLLRLLRKHECIEKGLQAVIANIPEQKQKVTEQLIHEAITDYCNLKTFHGLDLEMLFGNDVESQHMSTGKAETLQVEVLYSRLHETLPLLPSWFNTARMQCRLSPSLQSVALLGKVYKDCQVEDLSKQTSYACSLKIRKVMYTIILGQNTERFIEEYDRHEKKIQCFRVKPCTGLDRFPIIPILERIPYQTKEDTISLLFESMCISNKLKCGKLSFFFKFLLGLLVFWMRNSNSMVNETHCYCLILGVIALHMRLLKHIGQSVLLMFPEELRSAISSSNSIQIRNFHGKTDKYFANPNELQEHHTDVRIIHAFAMFQVCLKETLQLNELLMMPIEPPKPNLILNGSFFYNMYRRLQCARNQMEVLTDILGDGSPIYMLFITLLEYADLPAK